jgi:hypothetical protein
MVEAQYMKPRIGGHRVMVPDGVNDETSEQAVVIANQELPFLFAVEQVVLGRKFYLPSAGPSGTTAFFPYTEVTVVYRRLTRAEVRTLLRINAMQKKIANRAESKRHRLTAKERARLERVVMDAMREPSTPPTSKSTR